MARHGVDFETVKQTALKLLSKGISPSVQRIRESLGTGSNSTIAEHLKIWREQHAAKKVHHLPASIPEELINTFETLWQTAMEHAERHLSDVKESLITHEEKLNQEKMLNDKTVADLQSQTEQLKQNIDNKTGENQILQTQVAVINERHQKQADEINAIKNQHEIRLKHFYDEKNLFIDEINKLNAVIMQQKKEISDQEEKYRTQLTEERIRQEESEKRWIQLIDQARTEKNEHQKRYENTITKQNNQIDKLQSMISDFQEKNVTQQSIILEKNSRVADMSNQYQKLQEKYEESILANAALRERIKNLSKHSEKFKNKNQHSLAGTL